MLILQTLWNAKKNFEIRIFNLIIIIKLTSYAEQYKEEDQHHTSYIEQYQEEHHILGRYITKFH